jgi:hypothetical protein
MHGALLLHDGKKTETRCGAWRSKKDLASTYWIGTRLEVWSKRDSMKLLLLWWKKERRRC